MKYTGSFYDLYSSRYPKNTDDDNLYINPYWTVDFLVSDGYDAEVPLTLGADPITISMESGDTIYKPLKMKSATVNILTGNYYFNLYNSTVNNVGITLTRKWVCNFGEHTGETLDICIFKGYVSPNLYDQSYNEEKEEINIECTDALSSLKYINYLPDTKGIKTLLDVILYCVKQIIEPGIKQLKKPWIKYIILPTENEFQLSDLYLSDYAFFDDKKDNEKDTDVCMTCADVLEEICKTFGYVCYQEGDYIIFTDYDRPCKFISDNKWNYRIYNIQTNAWTNNTFYDNIKEEWWGNPLVYGDNIYNGGDTIKNISSGTENTLSLSDIYAKVTVKTKLRTFDSIFPNIFDNAYNITASSDYNLNHTYGTASGVVSDSDIADKNSTSVNKNMIFLIDQIYNDQKKKNGAVNAVAVRYYQSPYVKLYRYYTNSSTGNVTSQSVFNGASMNYSTSQSYRGGLLAKFWVSKLDNDKLYNFSIDWAHGIIYVTRNSFDQMMRQNNLSEISLSNYICLYNPSTGNMDNGTNPYVYPFVETVSPELTSFFGGKNTYLIISGKVVWHYKDDEAYPTPSDEYDPREGRRETSTYSNLFIPCKLQWGNKYWNGDAWTTTNTGFKLYYVDALTTNSYRADGLICKEFDIPNNVSWRVGTKEKGYCIPIPDDGTILAGAPKFTIYRPWNPKYNKSDGNKYRPVRMFLKNFDIKNIIGDPTYSENKDTNTVYTNTINDAFINKLDDIELKVCTYDAKSPSYNCLTYKDNNGNYHYLDKTNRYGNAGETMRLEEYLINRYCNQYKTPSKIIELDLNALELRDTGWDGPQTFNLLLRRYKINNFDCEFIVDSYKSDIKNGSCHFRFVEKK